MASDDDSNPYTLNAASSQSTRGVVDNLSGGLTDIDLIDLRLATRRAKDRSARFVPYFWPTLALLVAMYQFWMCWKVSQNSGSSFRELMFHDSAGFPADSYDGGLVRMLDRFVTGFCVLMAGGFMYFIGRTGRKRELQNARFHKTMLKAGLIPPVPNSTESQDNG